MDRPLCRLAARPGHPARERPGKMNPHLLPFPRRPRCNGALTLSFLIAGLFTSAPHLSLAAEQDPRMVAPPNAISGKLPGIAPKPARDAAKTFRVLDGFRM